MGAARRTRHPSLTVRPRGDQPRQARDTELVGTVETARVPVQIQTDGTRYHVVQLVQVTTSHGNNRCVMVLQCSLHCHCAMILSVCLCNTPTLYFITCSTIAYTRCNIDLNKYTCTYTCSCIYLYLAGTLDSNRYPVYTHTTHCHPCTGKHSHTQVYTGIMCIMSCTKPAPCL